MSKFHERHFLPGLLLAAVLVLLPAISSFGQEDGQRPQVVATFSILADLTARIGGEHIALHVLVGPNSDGHVYQPVPADARLLRDATLVITNGLGFEGWMERLIQASGYTGQVIVASTGVSPLMTGGGREPEPDPHAWQDLANARIYVGNILAGLSDAAPSHREQFAANAEKLLKEIDTLEQELHAAIDALPAAARTIVTSHDAFAYFGKAYGLRFIAPVGINTDSEASASDVARLIQQIRREQIRAVFIENITDERLLAGIASETGARIGGTLYSDALSPPGGPAASYIEMMRHNLQTITAALR